MMDYLKNNKDIIQLFFFSLLLVSVPVAISTYFENPVDLVKRSAFVIFGSLLIIFSIIIRIANSIKQNDNFTISFNRYLDIPLSSLIIISVISTLLSADFNTSLYGQYQREIGLLTFLYLWFIYYLTSDLLKSRNNFQFFILIIEITAVIVSVYSIIQMAGIDPFGIQPTGHNRPVTTFGNAVFFGGFLVLILPFSLQNIGNKKSIILKIAFPAVIAAGILISGTRSAYLAAAAQFTVGIILYVIIIKWNSGSKNNHTGIKNKQSGTLKKIFYISSGVISVLILFIIIFQESFIAKRIISIIDIWNNPRIVLWADSFNIFYKYPIFGTGPAMFSKVFEEFYSNRLRLLESTSYFDHPHSNFLYMLYSFGITGFIFYCVFLFMLLKRSFVNLKFTGFNETGKIYFTFLLVFTGYITYGLTNFDDITILLYLFVIAAAVKSQDPEKNTDLNFKPVSVFLIFIPVMFCLLYLSFAAVNDLKADRFFKSGNLNIKQGKFAEAVYNINTAIALNSHYTDYKFSLAYIVYRHCFSSETMPRETKNNLLNQALLQAEEIKNSHYYVNETKALISLIYYEMGKIEDAKTLEYEVLEKDSVNISYRLNLSRYYLKAGDINRAEMLMKTVLQIRPKSLEAIMTAAYLYFKKGDKTTAENYCNEVLIYEPENKFALKLLNDLKNTEK